MTNREEVAKKLREAARTFDKEYPNGAKDWLDENAAFDTVDEIIDTDDSAQYEPFFNRLADLIDPTCELKIQDGHACCGNCDHILAGEYESEEDYWCFRPYCPDCGARVVRDES